MRFFRMFYQHKLSQPGLKGTGTAWNEGRLLRFQNSTGRTQADRGTQLQICYPSRKKKNDSKGSPEDIRVLRAQKAEHQATEDYSQDSKLNGIFPVEFQACLGQWPHYSFYFLPTGRRLRMPILCQSHHCMLDTDNLFSRFTAPHMAYILCNSCLRLDLTHTWFGW